MPSRPNSKSAANYRREYHISRFSGTARKAAPSGGLLDPVIARASAHLADAPEVPVVDR
jgi:hypothetical protein